ncbi:MAG: DNA methylase [Leptospira sp.]|nr:MAG: DNA methylase [Leptospira sp.]
MEIEIRRNSRKSKLISKDRLPTNTLSSGSRIQRWANFIAGFSIEFIEQCLANRDKSEDVVIDPFLGCGTTLVGARNLGFKGIGFEVHPLFYTLSSAKLDNYSLNDLSRIIEQLTIKTLKLEWSESAKTYISKMFLKPEQDKIQFAAYQLSQLEEKLKPLGVAIFLKACEYSCTAQTDGIYKAPDSKKNSVPFDTALNSAANIFREDLKSAWYLDHWQEQPIQKIFNHSSESLQEVETNSLGICITSPPYLNNFDYAEMSRLQLYLLGWVESWGDISEKVRNKLITNTTTALKGKKTIEFQENAKLDLPLTLTLKLTKIVDELKIQRSIRAGKKDYDYLIYPYYQQINCVLKEIYRTLKKDGEIHWVVADAALYGIHIKTHEHTKELMENIGFENVKINWIRERGHRWILSKRDGSDEALGEYHLTASK